MWPANINVVSTCLAYSDDNGTTWTESSSGSIINNYADVTLPSASPNDGTWVNEVSQLIYDPNAVAAESWKILWHHYLIIHDVRHFEHGWIAMKAAATPEGLATATEIKLFGGYLYDSANDTPAPTGTTQSSVGGAPWSDYYSGCRIFRFANIDSTQLQMSGPRPALIGSVDGTTGSFNGACTYDTLANMSGMLYSEFNTSTLTFQIFKSHTNF